MHGTLKKIHVDVSSSTWHVSKTTSAHHVTTKRDTAKGSEASAYRKVFRPTGSLPTVSGTTAQDVLCLINGPQDWEL